MWRQLQLGGARCERARLAWDGKAAVTVHNCTDAPVRRSYICTYYPLSACNLTDTEYVTYFTRDRFGDLQNSLFFCYINRSNECDNNNNNKEVGKVGLLLLQTFISSYLFDSSFFVVRFLTVDIVRPYAKLCKAQYFCIFYSNSVCLSLIVHHYVIARMAKCHQNSFAVRLPPLLYHSSFLRTKRRSLAVLRGGQGPCIPLWELWPPAAPYNIGCTVARLHKYLYS